MADEHNGRIGLAFSGGGFRATLYHLGVVRFLRDAGILPAVSHITSVSGGSILAAHLVLNWDRYSGTPDQEQLSLRVPSSYRVAQQVVSTLPDEVNHATPPTVELRPGEGKLLLLHADVAERPVVS